MENKDEKKIDLNNLSVKDMWDVLEASNMDKILGITRDEYMFIANLPQDMDEQEIVAQLAIYRQYRKLNYKDFDKDKE